MDIIRAARVIVFGLALMVPAMSPGAATDTLAASFAGPSPATSQPWTSVSLLRANLGYSGVTAGAGVIGRSGFANEFAFNVNAPAVAESTLAEALAENEFLAFTLTPQAGFPLDLRTAEFAFAVRRDTYHAPRRYSVLASIDGFTTAASLFDSPRIDSSDFSTRPFRIFLPDDARFDGLTGPVTFRLAAYGANYNHVAALTSLSLTRYPGAVRRLTTGATGGGTLAANPPGPLVRDGERVTLTPAPGPGSRFAGYSGDITGKGNPATVTIDRDATVIAMFEPSSPGLMAVGMNVGGITDYGTDRPFNDTARRWRDWRTRNLDGSGAWDSGQDAAMPRDADGNPTLVPFDPPGAPPLQLVHTIHNSGFATTGTAVFRFRGAGTLRLIRFGEPNIDLVTTGGLNQYAIPIPRIDLIVAVEVRQTSAPDHLREFQFLQPGLPAAPAPPTFDPTYLARLAPYRLIRAMDLQRTNASPLSAWTDRTTTASNTQARGAGMALEHQIDLANALGQDLWICIPHLSDDDYVSRTARLCGERLKPDLKLHVEYSNETWNTAGGFTQTTWVQDRGEALGLAGTRWDAGQRYAALRSLQIFRIFEAEFPRPAKLVRTLATQSGNTAVTTLRVAEVNDTIRNPDRTAPDELAIAPYFGRVYSVAEIGAFGRPTVDQLVTTESFSTMVGVRAQVRAQKAIADAQGWRLVCYEGGQHFVGATGLENDTTLTAIMTAANRDPRMGDRYREYLDLLRDEGVELFANFSHVGAPTGYGNWGVLESQDQPTASAPKALALEQWIAGNPVPVAVSGWAAD